MNATKLYDPIKRGLDLIVSLLLLVVLSPLFLLLALLVLLNLGSPILFRQQRPGKHGTIFTLYKFRTMTIDSSAVTTAAAPSTATDAVRLTRFGRVLRSTSLDELPELFNILKGDMSFVGPRPLLVEYLPLYSATQAQRHDVRPGLTGLAQVGGRNALSWEDRFTLDVRYVETRSLWLDLSILFRTIGAVVSHRGVTEEGSATMTPFTGSR
jgi:lipopolysaccharide/colanic/teichoic acid biosynthesis glycosyltransferase